MIIINFGEWKGTLILLGERKHKACPCWGRFVISKLCRIYHMYCGWIPGTNPVIQLCFQTSEPRRLFLVSEKLIFPSAEDLVVVPDNFDTVVINWEIRRRSKNSRKTMKITYLSIYKLNTLYFITSCIIVVLLLRQTPPDKSSVKTILIIILLNFPVKEFQMFRSSQWYGVPLMLII